MAELLSLSTLTERDTIKIDETEYELRGRGELSMLEAHRLRMAGARIQALLDTEEPEDALLEELDRLTTQTVEAVVVDLPGSVLDALSPQARWSIIMAFSVRSMPARAESPESPAPEESRRAMG